MVVCLMVYGEETRRTATFADEEATTKIEDQWAYGDDQDYYNGCLMVSTVVFVVFKQL